MSGQFFGAAWTAIVTIAIIFGALVGVGFWLLARRKKRHPTSNGLDSLQQRANILLLRVDDAVKAAEEELAFAVAQFGTVKSQEFDDALVTAKAQLREAFGLQQKLDDAYEDTDTERRTWGSRIIHLCETARDSLNSHTRAFTNLRELEKSAPQNLTALRAAISDVDDRMKVAAEKFAALESLYNARAISSVADNIDRAATQRSEAALDADRAERALGDTVASSKGNSAADLINQASEHAYRAQQLLDAVGTLHDELAKASDALAVLRESTRTSLAGARSVRDAPPDPAAGAEVGRAIRTVESALATDPESQDPLATLEILRAANAELDASLAGARNQTQRLEGARTALVGALVGARSQLKATQNFIDNRRGGVGTQARTRLAEAERLLIVAEAEIDPVAALDTARSSATYSRDADALARFDLMGR